MGKCSNAIFPKVRVGTCYLSQDILILGHSRWSVCSFGLMASPSGHSIEVNCLPLTFDRIEIERLGMGPIVSFAKMHRMIWNMPYLAQHVTSRDLDLRSNFEIDLFRSTCTYFDAFRREEQDAAKIMSLAFLVKRLFAKNRFCKKALF